MKVDHRPEVKNRNQRIMKLAKETDEVFAVIHTPATFIRKQLAKMGKNLHVPANINQKLAPLSRDSPVRSVQCRSSQAIKNVQCRLTLRNRKAKIGPT